MRMWMVNPKMMCRNHLLGEHLEIHMFLGTLRERKKIDGFINNNLLEPRSLFQRHDELVNEMQRRGYNHKSPIKEEECFCISHLTNEQQYHEINRSSAFSDLIMRCPECHYRYKNVDLKNSY
jgi:hypothetical protein